MCRASLKIAVFHGGIWCYFSYKEDVEKYFLSIQSGEYLNARFWHKADTRPNRIIRHVVSNY